MSINNSVTWAHECRTVHVFILIPDRPQLSSSRRKNLSAKMVKKKNYDKISGKFFNWCSACTSNIIAQPTMIHNLERLGHGHDRFYGIVEYAPRFFRRLLASADSWTRCDPLPHFFRSEDGDGPHTTPEITSCTHEAAGIMCVRGVEHKWQNAFFLFFGQWGL
jgi:hypothetical protein